MSKVRWLCVDCAMFAGKNIHQLAKDAQVRRDKCDICKQKRPVTEPRAWGFFTAEQYTQVRRLVKAQGLHKTQNAQPEDVRRLVDVIRGVLGEEIGESTKTQIRYIEHALKHGHPVQLYDTKLLAELYARDVVESQRKRRAASGLVVVEGGIERALI